MRLMVTDTPLHQYWDTVNNTVDPKTVTAKHKSKYWWHDPACGHTWEATPGQVLTHLTKPDKPLCNYCHNRATLKGYNDLRTTHPQVAAMHHDPNLDITTVRSGFHQTTTWKCDQGHIFTAKVSTQVRFPTCRVCTNNQVTPGINDIATTHPHLLSEWDNTVSGNPSLTTLTSGSKVKVHWVCPEGHKYQKEPKERTSKTRPTNCPYCSNKQILVGYNDAATTHPHLLSEWDSSVPGNSPLTTLTAGSKVEVHWICIKGHQYVQAMYAKTSGNNCPYCSNTKILLGCNDAASTHPQLLKDWDTTVANNPELSTLTAGSKTKVHWVCKNRHKYQQALYNKVKGAGCPVCLNTIVIAGINDTATTHPYLVNEWDKTIPGNTPLTNITAGSNTKIWWKCLSGHSYRQFLTEKTKINNPAGCPICSNKKVLIGFNDAATTHSYLIPIWNSNYPNNPKLSEITAKSDKKVNWVCTKNHKYEQSIKDKVLKKLGCPVCSNKKTLSGFNDAATTHPHLQESWDSKTPNNPQLTEMTAKSAKKVWWVCSEGHQYEQPINYKSNGIGCPKCRNAAQLSEQEKTLIEYIQSLLPNEKIITSDRKLLKGKEIDIYIPALKIGIEYNGVYWHSEAAGKTRNYHHDKWLQAKQAGVQLIQIWEDEWAKNETQIRSMIAHKLNRSTAERIYARKTKVHEITKAEAEAFLNTYHIQGYASGSHYTALKHDNKIVAVLVLKKEPNYTNGLNIIRYATSHPVTGGFTKLLKHAERTYNPGTIITFSDHCVSDGKLYENTGFTADKEIRPDYKYLVKAERKHKFGYRIPRFKNDPNLIYEEGLTETELAKLNNLHRVWDAGKTRWVKHLRSETSNE